MHGAVVALLEAFNMTANQATTIAEPPVPQPVIDVRSVSKWFGNVVAVNDVTLQVFPGITGLLGPNGAGKTTLLHLMAGLAKCSGGSVTVLGEPVRDNPRLSQRVGVMSEHLAVYGFHTGRQFVEFAARMHGLKPLKVPVDRAIEMVGLEDAQSRSEAGNSRGMRQPDKAGCLHGSRPGGLDS